MKAQNKKQEIINKFWGPALDATSDAVSLTGREGKILICNKAMVKLIGRPYEEIIDSYCSKLLDQIPHPLNICLRELAKTSKKEK